MLEFNNRNGRYRNLDSHAESRTNMQQGEIDYDYHHNRALALRSAAFRALLKRIGADIRKTRSLLSIGPAKARKAETPCRSL